MTILDEFRRRNVHRVALGYLAGAWLLIQIADTVFPRIGFGETAITGIIALLAIGFLPALMLSWVFEWTPEGFRRERDVTAETARRSTKGVDRAITLTLILAVAYFAVDKFVIDPARDAAEIEAATEKALKTAHIESFGARSIIVLPFVNISPDPDQEYFADGVTEDILNLLAQISELRVISRSTAWTFKGKPIDIAAIKKKLNVSHVLEGSVRKAGDRIRITAKLIDARTDTNVWSDNYEKTLNDIFDLQDEISADIVSELKLKLLDGMPEVVEIDPRAYELYLRARHVSQNALDARNDEAMRMLRELLEIEPDFVPAIWELTGYVAGYYEPVVSREELEKGYAEVDKLIARMVELAPTSSYANGWIAHRAAYRYGDYHTAARHFELAVAGGTDWNRLFQLGQAGRFMTFLGRFDEAAEIFNYIISRDPACIDCIFNLSKSLRESGRHQDAARVLEEILEWHEPTLFIDWNLGVAWLVTGKPEKAMVSFNRLGDRGEGVLGRLLTLATVGPRDNFEAEFASVRENFGPEAIARVYAWSGQNDLAFEWLDRMVEKHGPGSARTVKTDLYEPIKSDPRWQAFLEKNGAEDQDLSHVVFNPQLPEANWKPDELRPASSP